VGNDEPNFLQAEIHPMRSRDGSRLSLIGSFSFFRVFVDSPVEVDAADVGENVKGVEGSSDFKSLAL
jgi:hypothetical protein